MEEILYKCIDIDRYFYIIYTVMVWWEKWSTLNVLSFSSTSNLSIHESFKTMLQTSVSFRILCLFWLIPNPKRAKWGWNMPACTSCLGRYIKQWVEDWIKERQRPPHKWFFLILKGYQLTRYEGDLFDLLLFREILAITICVCVCVM